MIGYNLFRKQLYLFILFFGLYSYSNAQGWTFTFQLAQSGPCPAGVALPAIPSLPNFGISTKGQCEALRSTILGIKESVPEYDNKGRYIGECTIFYNCTPCTGSDIVTAGQINPGDVSFDNQYQGKPIFTTHQSAAFEDWAKDYKQQLESYGIKSILGKNIAQPQIPLTDDKNFNQLYDKESANFNPKVPAVQAAPKKEEQQISYKAIPVMGSTTMTPEEMERDRLIKQMGPNYKGYIDGGNMFNTITSSDKGIDENTPPAESFSDQALEIGKDLTGTKYSKWVGNLADVVCSNASTAAKILGSEDQTTITKGTEMQFGPEAALFKASVKTITDEIKDKGIGYITDKAISVVEYVGEKASIVVNPHVLAATVSQDYKDLIELGKDVMEKSETAQKYYNLANSIKPKQ